jgi:hypothetical protein
MGESLSKGPAQWVGVVELEHLLKGTRIDLPASMETPGAAVQCACGYRATTRTSRARDEFELEHRRYHDWKARHPEPAS